MTTRRSAPIRITPRRNAPRRNAALRNAALRNAFLLTLAFLVTGCGSPTLTSIWRDRDVVIDGKPSEWEGVIRYIESENVSVGLLNDEQDLYICLVTGNRQTQTQVLAQGLTLWFDPDGGEEKSLGIRFPLGLRDLGHPGGPESQGARPEIEELIDFYADRSPEMEFLTGEYHSERMPVVAAAGIEVAMDYATGTLVYELRIPLQTGPDRPFAVGLITGSTLGLGLETPKIEMAEMRKGKGGGMSGGGRGGGRGGGGGGGGHGGGRGGASGGGMGRGGFQPPDPINLWAKVEIPRSAETAS